MEQVVQRLLTVRDHLNAIGIAGLANGPFGQSCVSLFVFHQQNGRRFKIP